MESCEGLFVRMCKQLQAGLPFKDFRVMMSIVVHQ